MTIAVQEKFIGEFSATCDVFGQKVFYISKVPYGTFRSESDDIENSATRSRKCFRELKPGNAFPLEKLFEQKGKRYEYLNRLALSPAGMSHRMK
jgi:hypothetical protein